MHEGKGMETDVCTEIQKTQRFVVTLSVLGFSHRSLPAAVSLDIITLLLLCFTEAYFSLCSLAVPPPLTEHSDLSTFLSARIHPPTPCV